MREMPAAGHVPIQCDEQAHHPAQQSGAADGSRTATPVPPCTPAIHPHLFKAAASDRRRQGARRHATQQLILAAQRQLAAIRACSCERQLAVLHPPLCYRRVSKRHLRWNRAAGMLADKQKARILHPETHACAAPGAESLTACPLGLLTGWFWHSMPHLWATLTAVRAWSPVTITVRMSASWQGAGRGRGACLLALRYVQVPRLLCSLPHSMTSSQALPCTSHQQYPAPAPTCSCAMMAVVSPRSGLTITARPQNSRPASSSSWGTQG